MQLGGGQSIAKSSACCFICDTNVHINDLEEGRVVGRKVRR